MDFWEREAANEEKRELRGEEAISGQQNGGRDHKDHEGNAYSGGTWYFFNADRK